MPDRTGSQAESLGMPPRNSWNSRPSHTSMRGIAFSTAGLTTQLPLPRDLLASTKQRWQPTHTAVTVQVWAALLQAVLHIFTQAAYVPGINLAPRKLSGFLFLLLWCHQGSIPAPCTSGKCSTTEPHPQFPAFSSGPPEVRISYGA